MHNYIQLRRIKEVRGQISHARVEWKYRVGRGHYFRTNINSSATKRLSLEPKHFEVSIDVSMQNIQDISDFYIMDEHIGVGLWST